MTEKGGVGGSNDSPTLPLHLLGISSTSSTLGVVGGIVGDGDNSTTLSLSDSSWALIKREDARVGSARILEQLILDIIADQRVRKRDTTSSASSSSSSSAGSTGFSSSSSASLEEEEDRSLPSHLISSSSSSDSSQEQKQQQGSQQQGSSGSSSPHQQQTKFFLEVDQLLDTSDVEALVFWARSIFRHTKELLRKSQNNVMDLIAERLLFLVDEKYQLALEKRREEMMKEKDLLYERGKNLLCLGKLLELGKSKALVRAHESYSRASKNFERTLELDGSQHRVFKHWAKAIDRLAFLRPSDKTIADSVDMFLVFYSNLVMKVHANFENIDLDELDLKPLIAIALSENKYINSKGIEVVRHLVKIMDEEEEENAEDKDQEKAQEEKDKERETDKDKEKDDKEFLKEARKNLRFLEEILAQRMLNKKVVKFEDLPEDCKKLIKTSGLTWEAVKDNYDAFLHCLWFERSKFKTPRKVQQKPQGQVGAGGQGGGQQGRAQQTVGVPASQSPQQPQAQRPKQPPPASTSLDTQGNGMIRPAPQQPTTAQPKSQPKPQQQQILSPARLSPQNSPSSPDPLFIYSNPAPKFRDYEKIGMGAYGNVYKARTDGKSAKPKRVAIKVMNVQNVRMLKHIRYEISVLSLCKHPNIVNYLEAYYYNNCVWCVMEYCDAGTLQLMIRHYQLEEWEICYVAKQLLRAIHFLHERNYIHRDIKPENVLLTSDSQIKLADLGLCTQLTTAIESKMAVSGSSYWIAPEMILHEPYGCKVDIWSFGCVLMEMAERKPPYGDFRALKAIFYTATRGPPKLQTPNKWTTEFVDCVESCMQYDPDNRPTSGQLTKHPFVNRSLKEKLVAIRPVFSFDLV